MTERLSAWMDGELEYEQAHQLLSQMKRDSSIRGNWDYYHLIGDTMRGLRGPDLRARLCSRLAVEPTVLAPQPRDSTKKLHWLPSAARARVAAVGLVAFVSGMAMQSLQYNSPQISTIAGTEINQATAFTDERAKSYVLAHLHYSTSKALQGIAMYTRVAQK